MILVYDTSNDRDDSVSRDMVDVLEEENAGGGLVACLRRALRSRADTEVRWERA